ncbi:Deuterolysin metalloprotease family protein [Metarhizium acridum CQMa 102]|uniref:Deuterolysin metalloprotease family protein n=1 Tax=Metarhizium acridum (strain CQMa 102) TaxID=655827 RepID=E9DX78_METAQ|nr:Deuterolysin metalloprotease family protein [Metarhizium acridum CQMa 102]EFY91636.1 Deuterolysin metalloprotease family protein [Metarhizium acridum CQMa 102]
MRLIGIVTALSPATVMALSISGRASFLESGAGPSLTETFEGLAKLGVLNGSGCSINEDELAEQKRANQDGSCANNQQEVDAALASCAQLAKKAEQAAREGSSIFEGYFKTNDPEQVAQHFARIADGCGHGGNQPITIECTPNEPCTLPQTGNLELAAVATIKSSGPGHIRLCRSAFRMSSGGRQRRQNLGQGPGCGENLDNMGELLVHEMSHTTVASRDVAYGKRNALSLSTEQSLSNAENYALFARDAANNCGGAGPGNGNQPPNDFPGSNNRPPNGFPGSNNGPPNGFPGSNNGPPNGFPGSNNGPPNGFPGSNNGPPNGFPDSNNGPPNGFPGSNNGPSNGFPGSNNGPPNGFPGSNNGPPNGFPGNNNGPPNTFPGFDNQPPNGPPGSNNFQPGGNNNGFDFDPSILSDLLGSNDFLT